MPIKNTGLDNDPECKFYFSCDCCGEPIEDLDGVVDFPHAPFALKIKEPIRFYHRGGCAQYGDKRRFEDRWGNFSLSHFLDDLTTTFCCEEK